MKQFGAYKNYASLFIPLLLEQGAITLITFVNTALVSGKDNTLINAISLVDALTFLLTAVFLAISTGGAILCANYYGAGEKEKIRAVFRDGTVLGVAVGVTSMLLAAGGGAWMIRLVYPGISVSVFHSCAQYVVFSALSFPFYFLFANNTGIARACGDTRSPMLITVLQGTVNLSVTSLLLFGFQLGMLSVGFGLLLSRLASAAVSFFPIKKYIQGQAVQAKRQYREILRLAVFIALETLFFFLGKLLLQSFIAALPDAQITANAVSSSLLSIFTLPGLALCVLTQNVCGNLAGAGNYFRLKRFFLEAWASAAGMLLCISLVSFPLLKFLIGLHTDDPAVFAAALPVMRFTLLVLPLTWPAGNLAVTALRGCGKVRLVSAVLAASMWMYRVPVSYYLCSVKGWGTFGVWVCMDFEWLLYCLIFSLVLGGQYLKRKKKSLSYVPA
ncbi:MAG: hypothetical protein LBS36_08455 [Oscillospiraceae bacterium]|jgi:putative MATE family efflux protein|nr:hypothetical protein [Oscillospiraceae bacterium]